MAALQAGSSRLPTTPVTMPPAALTTPPATSAATLTAPPATSAATSTAPPSRPTASFATLSTKSPFYWFKQISDSIRYETLPNPNLKRKLNFPYFSILK